MKIVNMRIALAFTLSVFAVPALADNGDQGHKGQATDAHHGAADTGERTLDELFGKLDETMKSIADAIGRDELSNIHNLSSDLSRVVNAVPSKVEPGKRTRVEGTVRNIAALSDELHVVADRKDKSQVEAKFERLQRLVALLESQAR